jgi:precorrin-2 dehydrogenase/sirohydrochlorin ferrochelatase
MVRVGLAGNGEALERRLSMLRAGGVEPMRVPADARALAGLSLLYIAGLDTDEAADLARRARSQGVLVNVEDRPEFCDFHVPAIVRRGDLALTVSTSGRAPGLARRLREWLEQHFGTEWHGRLEELGSARNRWRAEGVPAGEISERTRQVIDQEGWLP